MTKGSGEKPSTPRPAFPTPTRPGIIPIGERITEAEIAVILNQRHPRVLSRVSPTCPLCREVSPCYFERLVVDWRKLRGLILDAADEPLDSGVQAEAEAIRKERA